MEMMYLRTQKIDSILKNKLDNYTVMWEHEWHEKLRADIQLKKEIDKFKNDICPPPTHRDCFFGGRYVTVFNFNLTNAYLFFVNP